MESFDLDEARARIDDQFRSKIREDLKQKEFLNVALQEYIELDNTLATIVAKRKHEILVPIGKKAFIPGYIKKTNEMTVAIGENYFVKCSVQHARGIVERRRHFIEDKIHALDEDFNAVKSKLGMMSEVLEPGTHETDGGFIEIVEHETDTAHINIPNVEPEAVTPKSTASKSKPIIEVISENVNEEEDDDFLILEHFAKLEKLAESNPHTPSEMMKQFEKFEVNNVDPSDTIDEKAPSWGGSNPVGSVLYMERNQGEKSFFGGASLEIKERTPETSNASNPSLMQPQAMPETLVVPQEGPPLQPIKHEPQPPVIQEKSRVALPSIQPATTKPLIPTTSPVQPAKQTVIEGNPRPLSKFKQEQLAKKQGGK